MQNLRQSQSLVTPAATMADSKLFRDFKRMFVSVTGLQLVLQDIDSSRHVEWPCERATTRCAILARGGRSCSASKVELTLAAKRLATSRNCCTELHCVTVPVRIGNLVIALLQIEPVCFSGHDEDKLRPDTSVGHDEIAAGHGDQLKSPVQIISHEQCSLMVLLLENFAPHLVEWYVKYAPTQRPGEPVAILRAKEWIEAHYHETVTLTDVAMAAQQSPSQMSRIFHRVTGTTLTEFVSRARIARARRLLAVPVTTITNVAFAVGFQSISQFNRTFKKLVGQSPTKFRAELCMGNHAFADSASEARSSEAPWLRAVS